jgi:hypothetical protein
MFLYSVFRIARTPTAGLLAEKVEKDPFPVLLGRALIEKKRADIRAQIDALQETDQRLVDFQAIMCQTFRTCPSNAGLA